MTDIFKLPEGLQIAKSVIFYPTGNWSIHKGDMMVLYRQFGWRKYYEAMPADGCYFKSREDALGFLEQFEKESAEKKR